MSSIDPNYEVKTLLAAFDEGPIVSTFLRDTFFAGREYPPTNLVEFDFRRGRRKMAPFVAPLVTGKVMERLGYETKFFRAPRIAPVRPLRIPDLEARLPGETIYSGRTAADRAAELMAEDSEFLDNAISRREEWMCRELLVNGNIVVTADHGYTNVIDFTGGESLKFTIPKPWTDATADPLADLEAARISMIQKCGIAPDVALFGTAAASAFTRSKTVQTLLDNRRFEMGLMQPVIKSPAVIRFGQVPGLELYQYSEWFEDDAGNLFEMLPTNLVILTSTTAPNKIVYGAYTQLEDVKARRFQTYQTDRIPFVYGSEENGHLFYRLTACPVPMPADVLGFCQIEALPAPVGLEAGKQASFKGNEPSQGESGGAKGDKTTGAEAQDYSELTVPELRDLARERGLEFHSDARKDDLVALLEKDDKKK